MSALQMIAVAAEETPLEFWGNMLAALLTLCIFSFLYRDNPAYKFAEHVMVGLAMGYFAIYYMLQVLEPQLWDRLVGNELKVADTVFGSDQAFRFALIIPSVFGIMMILRVVPKVGWISRWSIAAMIGIGSGSILPWVVQARITTHLQIGTTLPIQYWQSFADGTSSFSAGWEFGVPILVFGTVCALIYFFFSVPHRGPIGHMATAGIWIMMIGFGASFGYTVMARLSLLIGRVLFLLKDWLGLIS